MWLLPSRARPIKLKSFLRSAIETEISTPGLVIVQTEDYDQNEKQYDEIEDSCLPNGWKFALTETEGFGNKVREVWPQVENESWVGVLNDDFIAVTKGWDKILTSALNGKNFTSSNDRWMAPQKATTATAWSMGLLKAVGWPIFPPTMRHLFIDDIWERIGRATGSWRICMNAVVLHKHALKDRGLVDVTHNAVYNQESWLADKAVFEEIMAKDFQGIVDKVKALHEGNPTQRFNPEFTLQKAAPL